MANSTHSVWEGAVVENKTTTKNARKIYNHAHSLDNDGGKLLLLLQRKRKMLYENNLISIYKHRTQLAYVLIRYVKPDGSGNQPS